MDAAGGLEPKLLYRRLDGLFGRLDPTRPARVLMESFLRDVFASLADDLGLRAGWLYAERRDAFELTFGVGATLSPFPEELDPQAPPLKLALQHGVYLFDEPPVGDEASALPRWPSAAVVVGTRPARHVLWLELERAFVREELDFALNTIRAALGSRLLDERVRGSVRQAAEIQQSLLLDEPPPFAGYGLAARSVAAEEVGGDFFDFLSFEDGDLLGLSIGDASGHGLPAALLVRDVVTGLRMGLEKDLKVAYVFTKLNRVIHRSNLSSRFVSVFYGELEEGGNLIYVNAGHPPPLLFSGEHVLELTTGGTVIGPLPEARFRRGVAYLAPGDLLVLTTDGILERRNRAGEFFGDAGVRACVRRNAGGTAPEVLEALFAEVVAFGGGRPWEDDATAMVVRREGAA